MFGVSTMTYINFEVGKRQKTQEKAHTLWCNYLRSGRQPPPSPFRTGSIEKCGGARAIPVDFPSGAVRDWENHAISGRAWLLAI